MSKKNKVYLTLIVIGLSALGIDRFYFGVTAPTKSSASQPGDSEDGPGKVNPPNRPRPQSAPPASTAMGVPELRFPRNLPPYNPQEEMRDLYAPIDELPASPASGASPPDSSKNRTTPEAIGRDAFSASHDLHAIFIQDGLKIAVLNGRWLRIGDTIDTCTVIRIEGDLAAFECHDGVTELSTSKKKNAPRR